MFLGAQAAGMDQGLCVYVCFFFPCQHVNMCKVLQALK